MDEFRIICPENVDILLSDVIPPGLQHYRIRGSISLIASGGFGNMLFHHFKGEGFDIWYSNYLMKQSSKFIFCMDKPVLKLHIPLVNDFESSQEGLKNASLKNQQFEITYVPSLSTTAAFRDGEDYHTIDIHFTTDILQPYAAYCPGLADFLDQVEKGLPCNMLNRVHFLSLDMIRVINDIVYYKYTEELAGHYFKNLVHELLILLTSRLAALTGKHPFSSAEEQQAIEAKKIILSDFEVYHNVEKFARMVGTSELGLQMAFKQLFGTTVVKFSRQARLEYGYRLLTDTNYPLEGDLRYGWLSRPC
jgi:AraC-like DNA-binding protein